jgi:hypothetical protein
MTKVRRSARLAKKPTILAVELAQRNMCHKLDLSANKLNPIEVLCEFIITFHDLLLAHVVVTFHDLLLAHVDAVTVIFNLDHNNSNLLDEALLQHIGAVLADSDPS